jgi:hypothetical protein
MRKSLLLSLHTNDLNDRSNVTWGTSMPQLMYISVFSFFEFSSDTVLQTMSQRGGGMPPERLYSVPTNHFLVMLGLPDHCVKAISPVSERLHLMSEWNQAFL